MEATSILQSIAALIFVIALIGICAVLYRRLVLDKNLMKGGKERRLKLEETLYLDAKRKLVLVKKDNEEILLLIGANNETVVEQKTKK